jgi:uncharacterized protein DUF2690
MIPREFRGVIVSAALLAGVLLSSPAKAVTCSGYGCEGLDPTSTGCASDGIWKTAKTFGSGGTAGAVQFMWSQTCHTMWVRVSSNNLGTYSAFIDANSLYTTTGSPYYNNSYDYTQSYNPLWTYHLESKMLYTAGGSSTCCSDTRSVKSCGSVSGVTTNSCIAFSVAPFSVALNELPDECP